MSTATRFQSRSKILLRIRGNAVLRIALMSAALFGLYLGLRLGANVLAHAAPTALRSPVLLVSNLVGCVLMILAYRLGVRLLECRDPNEIVASEKLWLFLAGAMIGGSIFIAVYAILWGVGIAHYEGVGASANALTAMSTALAAAVGEEIVFRGVIFRIADQKLGSAAAIALSALIFGVLHAANKGATVWSATAIAIEAGVLLAAAYLAFKSLWLPIGIHFGWNFTEGGVFGAAVSGGQSKGIFVFPLQGDDLYTGGAFGPEASVVAVALSLAVSVILIWMAISSSRWRPYGSRSSKLLPLR
jgi:uncharacterized protein